MALKVVNVSRPMSDHSMFDAAGIELVQQQVGPDTTKAEYIDILRGVDGAMIGTLPLTDRQVLEACPNLKLVSRPGVGVASTDPAAAPALGLRPCTPP